MSPKTESFAVVDPREMSRTRWEYDVLHNPTGFDMDVMGGKGWEAFAVTSSPNGTDKEGDTIDFVSVYFKRPRQIRE